MKDILVNAKLLRQALELWRQADYHWALEFGPVPAHWTSWEMRHDAVFKEVDDALREYGH